MTYKDAHLGHGAWDLGMYSDATGYVDSRTSSLGPTHLVGSAGSDPFSLLFYGSELLENIC